MDKENNINSHNLSCAPTSNEVSTKRDSESFKAYHGSTDGSSKAIAGAMRALQNKIKGLEQENVLLKECF